MSDGSYGSGFALIVLLYLIVVYHRGMFLYVGSIKSPLEFTI
ncbi:hypothetical protein [Thermaerobacillus caldiproteolyticus]|nr:hypothetical protein [Anoxybacillus caldiproteolyticus]